MEYPERINTPATLLDYTYLYGEFQVLTMHSNQETAGLWRCDFTLPHWDNRYNGAYTISAKIKICLI